MRDKHFNTDKTMLELLGEPSKTTEILLFCESLAELTSLKTIIDSSDTDIVCSRSCEETLNYLGQREFATVVIDFGMIRKGGNETARQLGNRLTNCSTPTVFLINDEEENAAYAFGNRWSVLMDCLTRPIRPDALRMKAALFVRLRRMANQSWLGTGRMSPKHETFFTLVESIPDAVLVTDAATSILFANRATEQVLGVASANLLGEQLGIPLITHDFAEIELTRRKPEPGVGEIRIAQSQWGENSANLVVIRDVTERKKAETERKSLQEQLLQSQKLESVGRLAGGIAHDFNNMLQAILGYTEMILDDMSLGAPFREDLEEMRRVELQTAALTRQLLTFARQQTISPEILDMNTVVSDMLPMLRRLIGEDRHLSWTPGVDLWPVKMDPTQVMMILTNLCANARDATTEMGRIVIECENIVIDDVYCIGHGRAAIGEYVMLMVRDDGCGMDKQTLGKVFEPFFTTKPMDKGTGMGLATVHGVAMQNGGFVNVYSELDEGTVFRVYIPRHQGTETTVDGKTNLPDQRIAGGCETILVVEDEPDILQVCGATLKTLGYQVLLADTPDHAIHLADEHAGTIDLLLSDMIMPGMNGRTLAERIRLLCPGISCIHMSGYTASIPGPALDEQLFLAKPFTKLKLAKTVRQVLDRRRDGNA